MIRLDTFAMRVNADERRMIEALAKRLERTQSDAVRLVIKAAAQELTPNTAEREPAKQGGSGATSN